MLAVRRIHFRFRMGLLILPPFLAHRRKHGPQLFRHFPVCLRHFLLPGFIRFLSPGHIGNRCASGFLNPLINRLCCFKHVLLRPERMGMFLKDHIIIMSIKNVKPDLRLLLMLMEEPAAMGDHCHLTGNPFLSCKLRKNLRHIIKIGVAVANK